MSRNLFSCVIRRGLALALAILLVAGAGFVFAQSGTERGGGGQASSPDRIYTQIQLLNEVLKQIRQKYVKPKSVKELIYGAIKGMVSSLDPHSSFMTPKEYRELQIETSGRFSGVGIEITIRKGVLTVVSPIEGTPAYKAGVKAGDKIMKVDGKITKNMTLMDAVRAIRGPRGSPVILTVLRKGAKKLLDIKVTRDLISIVSVKYWLIEPGYAYIRISTFQEKTGFDLRRALRVLESRRPRLKGLILDLRNNPGGLLHQAVMVAREFLTSGIIVYTKGRIPSQNVTYSADSESAGQGRRKYPIIILINGGSASASEIVAGALQDHRRALLMGTHTFGKGSVQTIIPLSDHSGLRLTTAHYYTPSGRLIQKGGIKPDIKVTFKMPKIKKDKKGKPIKPKLGPDTRRLSGKQKRSKLFMKWRRIALDNQLRAAMKLIKKRSRFRRLRYSAAPSPKAARPPRRLDAVRSPR